MALESYFDFADNDYQYFMQSYENGLIANMMGAMAQGICEKYMKHLICEYSHPDDAVGNEQRALAVQKCREETLDIIKKYSSL